MPLGGVAQPVQERARDGVRRVVAIDANLNLFPGELREAPPQLAIERERQILVEPRLDPQKSVA
jgi:hypothetical protein